MKKVAIGGLVGVIVVFVLIVFGLYQLGDDDQSALERLRDISVILIVMFFVVNVLLLAVITAIFGFLVLQLKDRVIPILEEFTGTAKQIRGTAAFVGEEAVKPIIGVAGAYSRMRKVSQVVTGRTKKAPKPQQFERKAPPSPSQSEPPTPTDQ